ncbi:DEAD/DEAH box helicase family protein [Dactylosporangium sp. NBC_01737]|uniref:DEAD/DEAH box helicase n=1 Tax=Dactylosporangium sp. NBC_01737 TaxID=2975959 RepID=UPI002E0D75D5|nr:DEAD/DEAH box helicase family protein [Dactylosporangium sp. NBC_01737]
MPQHFGSNPVKQLIAPSSVLHTVSGTSTELQVGNNYGSWAAATADRQPRDDRLWIKLPVGTRVGDQLHQASWVLQDPLQRDAPPTVLESYRNALTFNEGTEEQPGLRSPQLGAVHAVLGYWTTKRTTPATVVMPTGTGKTETMLALLVAARLPRVLVIVPSDALREQIAAKFQTLGILQQLGIVDSQAIRPVVGRVQHRFEDPGTATAFAEACNVIVATPQSLNASSEEAMHALLEQCSHLFVDEAHHVTARTWSAIRDAFAGKNVVQFTATPFREDGKHLHGSTIYSFPLREAQAQRLFASIDYQSVIDFYDVDEQVAKLSVARLRRDRDEGYDHVLMARVNGIPRAKQVKMYYDAIAADLNPVIINSQMPKGQQHDALTALRDRTSRIIICVNMLGEGFDLPALKVAAVHDPQKSLAVTLQFIGRFARTSAHGNFGAASMFVARSEIGADHRLRELYAEDSDWNVILRNLTEAAVEEQRAISEFESGFTSMPKEVTLRNLLPKMSTVVYRTPTSGWEPLNLAEYFGEEQLYTQPIGINHQAGVAWCVVERHTEVSWGDVKSLEDVTYELFLLYFDATRRLLYINNSANDGVFEDLADAVVGVGAKRFTGSTVYRVMADIDRLVPTNVGVIDAHDQFRRFSMHVGSDVTASFSQAEAGTKSQTNISGGGYRDGEHVNISASLKGRIWSAATAQSIKQWRDWCNGIGELLLDDTISIDKVIGQFILPEPLKGRPDGVLLAVEWPWTVHTMQAESLRLEFGDKAYEAVHTDLIPDTENTAGPFRFTVKSGAWAVEYEATVEGGVLRYRSTADREIKVIRPRSELLLSDWLNANGLLFVLDGDRIIENDLIYKPTWDKPPYDRSQLTPLRWAGTNLKVESQTKDKLVDSIQYRAIAELKQESWDVLIDDDGAGEIADIVAMRLESDVLLVRLIHCKYSHEDTPGARVADLYEVCGQAQKSIMWRRSDLLPFFRTLADRARKKFQREGVSPFEIGDFRTLHMLQEKGMVLRRKVEIVIAQPGLSAAKASTQQLDLLASTQAYLKTTINAPLTVWCSA